MNQEKIGKFILSIRKSNHLSQSKFAEILGVTSQAVSKWENGRGIPDIEILKKISEEFHVEISEIINGERNNSKKHFFKERKTILICIAFTFLILLVSSIFIYQDYQRKHLFDSASISSQ